MSTSDQQLAQVLELLQRLHTKQEALAEEVAALRGSRTPGVEEIPCGPAGINEPLGGGIRAYRSASKSTASPPPTVAPLSPTSSSSVFGTSPVATNPLSLTAMNGNGKEEKEDRVQKKKGLYPSRVVLTTYPGQAGINPVPINWGAGPSPLDRGPVVCSRIAKNLLMRNSIGAHAGSYSIYRALSIAMGQLSPSWRPDLCNTHPPFTLPPQPGWFGDGNGGNEHDWKIVSFDPWGAMVQEIWGKEYGEGLDVRPTISQTKAHIKIEELDALARKGEFPIDGDIVIKSPELSAFPGVDQGVEVNTFKAAVDPVWYLPGVAERLGIDESTLRRALFEDTGGMYPELLTRPDIKIFLPPIGGMTVYIMGDPAKLSDPNTEVTCRPHDSCSGSDVFGSDICTCRPYLIFGISEAIKCAQRGGVGVVVYFQKEGRALGEVVKYMVYNRRKRGGDSAAEYFNNTSAVAGVKDARHQALMPDVLHWLGITHITNLISMSNMKYDAIIKSGITVQNRYEIPDELIPADGRVEIDAKIQAGYFSKKEVTDELVQKTKGRNWEDIVH
ncbi:uncharacterized protein CcaverHIS019_0103540 [Cutaneotrichosporon cavernicola]|uniref:Cyclohydrolase n=1 Tax=Cutaneotrichosporon cavernicola TaxID=279322 RepID=A0AA48KYK2_9TREE|nr:uncharacterized protein CcaverHIS019_0103540 [Cutaneotrichosporon cavernicola]BEI87636.1 hypothetical protein CcaverHIS019_0103540 [Cutaneotrichosporon cavernicola]